MNRRSVACGQWTRVAPTSVNLVTTAPSLQTAGHITFQQPGQAPRWQWLFEEDDSARHVVSAKHWHDRSVGWRPREFNRAQPIERCRSDRLEHVQYVLLVRGMMKSVARFSHDNPKLQLAILFEFPFARFGPGYLPISSQLTSSAQIAHTAPIARGAESASRADRFGVCVFTPGHRCN